MHLLCAEHGARCKNSKKQSPAALDFGNDHSLYSFMIGSKGSGSPRLRGRPREFDVDDALDKAIRVFREHGYAATSIGDLTAAMELTTGSVYKAFKDKRAIFLAAFDRYTALRNDQVRRVSDTTKPGREKLRDLLTFYVESSRGSEGRRGCLVVGSAVELAMFDPEIAARVTGVLRNNEAFLASVIRQGQADGSIASGVDADNTARVMVFLTQGMRVVGKTGRPPPDPATVVDIAMKLVV
jgi:TetR/AcrR family transcriptional regulator, transcriptional repressor for nem operon